MDFCLGPVHLYLQMRIGRQQSAAHVTGDFRGFQREFFVRPLGLAAEGGRALHGFLQIFHGCGADIFHVFLADGGPADGDHAKHLAANLQRGLDGRALLGLHIEGGLDGVDLILPQAGQAAADNGQQLILKAPSIQALEHQLAAFEQQNFIHSISSLS